MQNVSSARVRALLAACAALTVLGMARAAGAQCTSTQLCAPGAGDCVISANCTVPAGSTFDIRPRALIIKAGKMLTVGAGFDPLTIFAGSILLEPGAKIDAAGVAGVDGSNGAVYLDAATTFTMQAQGGTISKIDVSGPTDGSIDVHAGGDVNIAGLLAANAQSSQGSGGFITIESRGGAVSITGAGFQARTDGDGIDGVGGGDVSITAVGAVSIAAPMDISGGDCSGCEIGVVSSQGAVTVTSAANLDVSAFGRTGDGGLIDFTAATDIVMNGTVNADGRGSSDGPGNGGELDLIANDTFTYGGTMQANGVAGGDGGTIDFETLNGSGTLSGTADLSATNVGGGGDATLITGTGLQFTGDVDVSGDAAGGTFTANVGGLASIGGTVDAHGTANGGSILIQACSLDETPGAVLDTRGPGTFPLGGNELDVSNDFTVHGRLLATSANRLVYRNVVPTVLPPPMPPPLISPPVTVVQDLTLPCCGVGCTTTTTTSTTSSTSSTSTTSTTETTAPTTTSTSSTSTTEPTTSSTVPTTTSTVPTTTTTSTTVVTTTSTSTSTTVPTTTTSSTTTSTSTTVPTTTTSSTTTSSTTTTTGATTTSTTASSSSSTTTSTTTSTTAASSSTTSSTVPQGSCGNGVLDPGEECDDGNTVDGDCCTSTCQKVADGTACHLDACTDGATCSGGVCSGGSAVECGPCERCDPEGGCETGPRATCVAAPSGDAELDIKRPERGAKMDKLEWRWLRGPVASGDFGNPFGSEGDGVALCVFDETTLRFRALVAPGGTCGARSCWTTPRNGAVKFASREPNADGITYVALTSGTTGKSRLVVKGKGTGLDDRPFGLPSLPLSTPLTVQLQSEAGRCWTSRFSPAGVSKNDANRFVATSD